jgi:hypothetical protein
VRRALREIKAYGEDNSVETKKLAEALAGPSGADYAKWQDRIAKQVDWLNNGANPKRNKSGIATLHGFFDKVTWPRGEPDAKPGRRWFLPADAAQDEDGDECL